MIKMLRTIGCVFITLLFLFFLPTSGFSQFTITSNDLLGLIGSTQTMEVDTSASGNVQVNVGSSGANQTWDFRSVNLEPATIVTEFLSPQGTFFEADFPQSNLVERITDPLRPGNEFNNYFEVTSSAFISLGNGSILTDPIDTSFVDFQYDAISPLPYEFNSTWMETGIDTTGFFPMAANISIDTSIITVDAWGTVRLPIGDFQCLRVREDVKIINQMIVNGAVFSTSTESYIQYNWISKDIFLVASAQSQDGETDPNFTNALGFGRLISVTVDVEDQLENTNIPSNFRLFQNYPNPFNPNTIIKVSVPELSDALITIYDINGKLVKTIYNGNLNPGFHEFEWKANKVSSGTYFIKFQTANFSSINKCLLLK